MMSIMSQVMGCLVQRSMHMSLCWSRTRASRGVCFLAGVPGTSQASGVVHTMVFQKCHRCGEVTRQCVGHYLGTTEGVSLTHPLAVYGQGEVYCFWPLYQERTEG
jgi:hypothetical protein